MDSRIRHAVRVSLAKLANFPRAFSHLTLIPAAA
jgi:hypothetical protein